jgi:hypothetical protein
MTQSCVFVKFDMTYQTVSTEAALVTAAHGTIIAGGAGTRET